MIHRWLLCTCLALAATSAAADPVIRVGSYTASGTSPFVVPVLVQGAVDLASFSFDLQYDANAYRIDTACDPFSDAACDFSTGPVTLGTFYTGAESFPALFNPGFVFTDASGEQTGLLSGVNGAWQDVADAPSGDGVLAFVEFTATGQPATAPISVVGQPAAAVPEPPSAWLLLAGLAAAGAVRARHARA
jgi:hypothetical protein